MVVCFVRRTTKHTDTSFLKRFLEHTHNKTGKIPPKLLADNSLAYKIGDAEGVTGDREMGLEKTFVMLKPSTVARAMIGKVVSRIEDKGLKIVAMKLTWESREKAAKLYAIHQGKPFYDSLVQFTTSGPVVAMVIEGDEAVKVVRNLIGATNAKEAQAGTIRGDFALSNQKNAIHASDSVDNAKMEMGIFFTADEILSYKRADDNWVY
jgi:nucleoside-diphosphate kinase